MPNPIPNEEDDVGGDVSQFEAPPINVDRFLNDVDPRYGEHVADSQKPWIDGFAKKRGEAFIHQIEQLGRRFSDEDGDTIMAVIRRELVRQLPANVDRSDLEAYMRENQGDVDEFFEDAFYEGSSDAVAYYIHALMPYIKGAAVAFAVGLDYGLPVPVSDMIRDEHMPDPPEGTLNR